MKTVFFAVLNLLVYVWSYPTPVSNDDKCLDMTPQRKRQIAYIQNKISDFLSKLADEFKDLDIPAAEVNIENHSDCDSDRETSLTLVVNNCMSIDDYPNTNTGNKEDATKNKLNEQGEQKSKDSNDLISKNSKIQTSKQQIQKDVQEVTKSQDSKNDFNSVNAGVDKSNNKILKNQQIVVKSKESDEDVNSNSNVVVETYDKSRIENKEQTTFEDGYENFDSDDDYPDETNDRITKEIKEDVSSIDYDDSDDDYPDETNDSISKEIKEDVSSIDYDDSNSDDDFLKESKDIKENSNEKSVKVEKSQNKYDKIESEIYHDEYIADSKDSSGDESETTNPNTEEEVNEMSNEDYDVDFNEEDTEAQDSSDTQIEAPELVMIELNDEELKRVEEMEKKSPNKPFLLFDNGDGTRSIEFI